ncbi:hypothetical protein LOK49_LG03G01852 [Camellia lanceoleosa]|uniref:Uncharacterized protein n=1 Tax=Camellia lanceoleosa TaxID=1840588 RepID=A0ACC0ICL4_9ERIC|nr:hypothetical protein LOK49_LG03G01852 [Camellia lanceoleosa]
MSDCYCCGFEKHNEGDGDSSAYLFDLGIYTDSRISIFFALVIDDFEYGTGDAEWGRDRGLGVMREMKKMGVVTEFGGSAPQRRVTVDTLFLTDRLSSIV